MHRITLTVGDITQQRVDAIVNAANAALCGGGGVDGAIHAAAGPELLEACRRLGGCETGGAKITPAFDLPAKFVIHAVGPVWYGGDRNEVQLLRACHRRSLELAVANDVKTIAFPAISCGAYRFPIPLAARTAIGATADFLQNDDHLERVIFVLFDSRTERAFRRALAELRGRS